MRESCLWIVITRPDNLVNALAAAALCKDRFARCRLIYEDSSWWRNTRWEEYHGVFDEIIVFPKVETCRGVIDLPRHYRHLVRRQRGLKSLHIAPEDTVFCLSGIMGLANALASVYPDVPKVLCVTKKKYDDSHAAADLSQYRHTTSSWFQYHLLEPLAGVGRTIQLKPRRKQGGDGVRITRLEKPLEEVFQSILIWSNTGNELPDNPGPTLVASPFPNFHDFARLLPGASSAPGGAPDEEKRAVFFGTPFLLVRNLPPGQYAATLNRCLEYIRHHYGDRCRLIYRPHPAETKEREVLDLDGFVFENDQEVAQLYYLKHFSSLEAVFSVSSTVSRVAYNYGLNAYSLWRCFPFGEKQAAYFETLMDVVPPEFDIRSLEAPPVPYASRASRPGGEGVRDRFAKALDRALDCAAEPPTREKAVARAGETAKR